MYAHFFYADSNFSNSFNLACMARLLVSCISPARKNSSTNLSPPGRTISKNEVTVLYSKEIKPTSIITEPYPGFPTDLQAQIMVLMIKAKGLSKIRENIFENRFMHVPELNRMGAKIKVKGNLSLINGPQELNGAEVMATDLRASVSLVLAGLIGKNRTSINRVYHLDRGYEFIEKKLKKCGANISRLNY